MTNNQTAFETLGPLHDPGKTTHLITRFTNNYGISVINGPYFYCGPSTYEVACIYWTGDDPNQYIPCYAWPPGNIAGWQTAEQVIALAKTVAQMTV